MIIYPIYVELQKKSPMGMRRPYNISEVDMEGASIGLHELYTSYVSKSLPLIMRNGCNDWGLKTEIDAKIAQGGTALEDYLISMFSVEGPQTFMKKTRAVEYTRLTRDSVLQRFQQGIGKGKNITNETFAEFQAAKKKTSDNKVLNFIEGQSLFIFDNF